MGRVRHPRCPLTRSLINTFPTWALAVLGLGVSWSLAAAGLLIVRKRFPGLVRAEMNEVAGIAIGVLAALYGIVLGFVIVSLYEQFESAEATVHTASGQLIQIYWDTLDTPIAGRMQDELRTYVATVRFLEFPLMREGKGYTELGDRHIGDMYAILRSYNPKTQSQVALYQDTVSELNGLVASRLQRFFDASQELPGPFEALLLIGAALLIASLYLLNVTSLRVHLTLVLGVTAILSLSLIVAAELESPFSGSISVSSQPFAQGRLAILHATPADANGP